MSKVFFQRWLRIDGEKNVDYRIYRDCADLLRFRVEGVDAERCTMSGLCDRGDELTLVSYAHFTPDDATAFVAVNPLLTDVAAVSAPVLLTKAAVGPLIIHLTFREPLNLSSLTWLARVWEGRLMQQPGGANVN